MTLRAGSFAQLTVAREVDPNGYYLTDGEQDVLLPYNEATEEIRIKQSLRVFLFHDRKGRLTATMKTPAIAEGTIAALPVADIHERMGCFLEMGIGRQLLLPYTELPELRSLWPKVGDEVYVTLAHDKQERMIAKLAGEKQLEKLTVPAPMSWRNTWMEARVYKPLKQATFLLIPGGELGFGVFAMLHEAERTRLLRLGEAVQVRVTYIREDGRVNVSMRPPKEVGREEDAEMLLNFLRERPNGAMPYSDQTPPDIILQRFNISKGAFKRAIGKLMKEGLVYQEGNWTYLREDGEQSANTPQGELQGELQGSGEGAKKRE